MFLKLPLKRLDLLGEFTTLFLLLLRILLFFFELTFALLDKVTLASNLVLVRPLPRYDGLYVKLGTFDVFLERDTLVFDLSTTLQDLDVLLGSSQLLSFLPKVCLIRFSFRFALCNFLIVLGNELLVLLFSNRSVLFPLLEVRNDLLLGIELDLEALDFTVNVLDSTLELRLLLVLLILAHLGYVVLFDGVELTGELLDALLVLLNLPILLFARSTCFLNLRLELTIFLRQEKPLLFFDMLGELIVAVKVLLILHKSVILGDNILS